VGKSTLFNRIVGSARHRPGRSRRDPRPPIRGSAAGRSVSGGGYRRFTLKTDEQLVAQFREQAEAAVREADAVVLVVDAVEGLSGPDRELVQLLRRGGKPVFLAANKVDSNGGRKRWTWASSTPRVRRLSSQRRARPRGGRSDGRGGGGASPGPFWPKPVRKARPSTSRCWGGRTWGRARCSTRLLGEERFVASALPGTTRDAVDEELVWKGRRLRAHRHRRAPQEAPGGGTRWRSSRAARAAGGRARRRGGRAHRMPRSWA